MVIETNTENVLIIDTKLTTDNAGLKPVAREAWEFAEEFPVLVKLERLQGHQ